VAGLVQQPQQLGQGREGLPDQRARHLLARADAAGKLLGRSLNARANHARKSQLRNRCPKVLRGLLLTAFAEDVAGVVFLVLLRRALPPGLAIGFGIACLWMAASSWPRRRDVLGEQGGQAAAARPGDRGDSVARR